MDSKQFKQCPIYQGMHYLSNCLHEPPSNDIRAIRTLPKSDKLTQYPPRSTLTRCPSTKINSKFYSTAPDSPNPKIIIGAELDEKRHRDARDQPVTFSVSAAVPAPQQ